jgi:hypothetical protein
MANCQRRMDPKAPISEDRFRASSVEIAPPLPPTRPLRAFVDLCANQITAAAQEGGCRIKSGMTRRAGTPSRSSRPSRVNKIISLRSALDCSPVPAPALLPQMPETKSCCLPIRPAPIGRLETVFHAAGGLLGRPVRPAALEVSSLALALDRIHRRHAVAASDAAAFATKAEFFMDGEGDWRLGAGRHKNQAGETGRGDDMQARSGHCANPPPLCRRHGGGPVTSVGGSPPLAGSRGLFALLRRQRRCRRRYARPLGY